MRNERRLQKIFGVYYRIVFSGCRNSINHTFGIGNHPYIQRKLCIKPE